MCRCRCTRRRRGGRCWLCRAVIAHSTAFGSPRDDVLLTKLQKSSVHLHVTGSAEEVLDAVTRFNADAVRAVCAGLRATARVLCFRFPSDRWNGPLVCRPRGSLPFSSACSTFAWCCKSVLYALLRRETVVDASVNRRSPPAPLTAISLVDVVSSPHSPAANHACVALCGCAGPDVPHVVNSCV